MRGKGAVRWNRFAVVASSVSFAIATVLDLADAGGGWRGVAVVLSVMGFVALGAFSVTSSIIATFERHKRKASLVAIALGEEPAATQPVRWNGHRASSTNPSNYRGLGGVDAIAFTPSGLPTRFRIAGTRDLELIAEEGGKAIGDYFYSTSELEAYLLAQRDAIWCLERTDGPKRTTVGYAILLALKPITVERIKSGEIVTGRDILSVDVEGAIGKTDAIYLAMIDGFDSLARVDIGSEVLRLVLESHVRRRPQLLLARQGTVEGGLGMSRLGFRAFGQSPFIRSTFTDAPDFTQELARRERLRLALVRRQSR